MLNDDERQISIAATSYSSSRTETPSQLNRYALITFELPGVTAISIQRLTLDLVFETFWLFDCRTMSQYVTHIKEWIVLQEVCDMLSRLFQRN